MGLYDESRDVSPKSEAFLPTCDSNGIKCLKRAQNRELRQKCCCCHHDTIGIRAGSSQLFTLKVKSWVLTCVSTYVGNIIAPTGRK